VTESSFGSAPSKKVSIAFGGNRRFNPVKVDPAHEFYLRQSKDLNPTALFEVGGDLHWEPYQPGFQFHRPYQTAPRKAVPKWAYENWRILLAFYKGECGATDAVLRALKRARAADLSDLVERRKSAKEHATRKAKRDAAEAETPTEENRAHARAAEAFARYEAAEKAFHCRWIAFLAIEVAERAKPNSRRDPYSHRSVKTLLSAGEQRTWEALRKLQKRPSKSTGKRKRGPSREARAFDQWRACNKEHATLIQQVVVEGERLPAIAHLQATTPGAILERLCAALAGVQAALGNAKRKPPALLKCPQKLPRSNYMGRVYPRPTPT
jgi:hypothetical protein